MVVDVDHIRLSGKARTQDAESIIGCQTAKLGVRQGLLSLQLQSMELQNQKEMIQSTKEKLMIHRVRVLRAYLLAYLSSTSPKVAGLLISLIQKDGNISKASNDVSADLLHACLASSTSNVVVIIMTTELNLICKMLRKRLDSCCEHCAEHLSLIDFLLSVHSSWGDP